MGESMAAIIVALISTVGVVLVGLMQLFKNEARENAKENREDHAIVQQQLRMIFKSVGRVDDKLDRHLTNHDEGTTSGKTLKRNL